MCPLPTRSLSSQHPTQHSMRAPRPPSVPLSPASHGGAADGHALKRQRKCARTAPPPSPLLGGDSIVVRARRLPRDLRKDQLRYQRAEQGGGESSSHIARRPLMRTAVSHQHASPVALVQAAGKGNWQTHLYTPAAAWRSHCRRDRHEEEAEGSAPAKKHHAPDQPRGRRRAPGTAARHAPPT